jgi:hypothetical protein
MPIIPTLRRLRQEDHVRDQSGLQWRDTVSKYSLIPPPKNDAQIVSDETTYSRKMKLHEYTFKGLGAQLSGRGTAKKKKKDPTFKTMCLRNNNKF